MRKLHQVFLSILLIFLAAGVAGAQSFRIQCPTETSLHRTAGASPLYTGPQTLPSGPFTSPLFTSLQANKSNGGAIKCQQISGGDGFATMADGTQTYLFAFGPLSGLQDIANGLPGTHLPGIFNTPYDGCTSEGCDTFDPTVSYGGTSPNGAVGLAPDPAAGGSLLTGHVDPRTIMDVGILNGHMPAPLMAMDEDDEFFLTLTNVGQIMRPDLAEEHTVHFHGYPNASSFFDGVPEASVAISVGGSFTYYYLAPDAGTYFWHCHIAPPEHLQMGMVGQLYVRPRQNRLPNNTSVWASLAGGSGLFGAASLGQQSDRRTKCGNDILCSTPIPPPNSFLHQTGFQYAYNDGDGSTRYDVEYPIQIHGFDPNFHYIGMTFNPSIFADMKDKYFLLNGRGYPDTINPEPLHTQSADGVERFSQPMHSIINIPLGGKALLRIASLDTTQFQTLASLGVPMHVIGINARLLRDMDGNDMTYYTNSITVGGGESLDVILDATDQVKHPANSKYFLYTPNLDHLSNDAENFGGLMTEVNICSGSVHPLTKACN